MDTLELGRIGISIDVSHSYLDDAGELEALGYTSLWLAGGQIDSLTRLSDLVLATETVTVVPGIVPVDVYDAASVGALFRDLEGTGRFVVGLGGPQSAKPLAGLNTYLDELDVPSDRLILAALGPRKLELAGQRAAGAVALLVTPAYAAEARKILGDATLAIDLFVVLETDPERARALARKPLSFLASVPGYRQNFLRMGFTSEDVDQLADRLVDAVVAWGSVDDISRRVQQFFDAGADHVVLAPLGTTALVAGRALSELVVAPK